MNPITYENLPEYFVYNAEKKTIHNEVTNHTVKVLEDGQVENSFGVKFESVNKYVMTMLLSYTTKYKDRAPYPPPFHKELKNRGYSQCNLGCGHHCFIQPKTFWIIFTIMSISLLILTSWPLVGYLSGGLV